MTRTEIKQAADEARDMKFGYRTIYEKYMIAADELIEKLEDDKAKLREAGQAIVARWDTPTWKDAEHTGVVISRMRKALKDTSDE